MAFPVSVTFHNTKRSDTAEALVREQAERLTRFNPRITACEVVIDVPHHNHNKGNEYHVRLRLNIPGHQLVTHSNEPQTGENTSLSVAIRHCFDMAERRLRNIKPRERRIRRFQREHNGDGLSAAAATG